MALSTIQETLVLGLILSIMSFGVFISFRILNIPDLTVDGSFTTGCAVSAICTVQGHPLLGILLACIAGACAGLVTGFLQTKGKVQPLMAGILTMTALYSINLKILGDMPNISLFGKATLFSIVNPSQNTVYNISLALGIVILLMFLLYLFLKTQLGMSIRATGDNEDMVRASSIHADRMKRIGMAISNGLVAMGGAIYAQNQGFVDVSGGIGMMVVGLAGIIVGEAFIRNKAMLGRFIAVVFGAILYRFMLTIALQLGIEASNLNLFSACLVAIAISLPNLKKRRSKHA